MGKKASAKRRQQALKRARKDGRVSGAEAKKLRSLGVSKNKITNTKKATVSKSAVRQAAKPAPKPKAQSKPKNNSTAAVNAARNSAQTTSSNVSRGDNQPTPPRPGAPAKGSTGNVKSGISGQQANKILRDFKQGGNRLPGITNTTVDDETGLETTTTTPGDINYDYYNNNRVYGKAKTALGINDINNLSELEEVRQYALSNQNPNAGKGLSEYGIRGSGEFDDIVAALGGDAQAGYDVAEQMRKKGITMTDPRYERTLKQLAKGVQGDGRFGSNILDLSFGRVGNNQLDVVNKTKYQNQLKTAKAIKGITKGVNDAFAPPDLSSILSDYGIGNNDVDSNFDVLNEQQGIINQFTQTRNNERDFFQNEIDAMGLQIQSLGSMADGFAATNTYLQNELNSANNAITAADQRAENMMNAFVPSANPNAKSILAGDYRKSRRRKEDNQLSDLAILTDVGSNTNPLAGLQLA